MLHRGCNELVQSEEWQAGLEQYGPAGMSLKARITRAKEQGYDTSTIYYHGSPLAAAIDGLKVTGGGELGKGVYFTPNLNLARNYALPRGEVFSQLEAAQQAGVFLVFLPKLKELTKAEFLEDRSALYQQEQLLNGGEWSAEVARRAEAKQIQLYREQGWLGIVVQEEHQALVFSPDDIRSIDSTFNPDFQGKPLMNYVPLNAVQRVSADLNPG